MKINRLYTEEQIQAAVQKVAQQIVQYYGKEQPVMALCLLNGAIWFAADLLRLLPCNFELQSIRVSSYEGEQSCGSLHWHGSLPDCHGKQVLVIDDILDTGLTLQSVKEALYRHGAAGVRTAVAISKTGRRVHDGEADFCALLCDNLFLVGYGLDYNGKYRNLPYIGYIAQETALQ